MKELVSQDHPDYFDRDNWIMLETNGIHTCEGVPENQITKLQFRNYVKAKMSEGQSDFDVIRVQSGVDEWDQKQGKMLGDDRTYRRLMTERRALIHEGVPNGIPVELTQIYVRDEETDERKQEKFYHNVDGREYLMIPSLLHYLSGNISADGTFYEVKDLPGTHSASNLE